MIIHASRFPAVPQPAACLRTLRAALRMSQAQLAKRSGIDKGNIARIESGKSDVRVATLTRLFDAMFCDLVIFPRPRKRPSDAVYDQCLREPWRRKIWD